MSGWRTQLNAGEPYGRRTSQADPRRDHPAPLLVLHRPLEPPAPMLISNGFTDDLFPADEAIRFYNRTRTQYPDADICAVLRRLRPPARARTRPTSRARCSDAEDAWFDYYVKGDGAAAVPGRDGATRRPARTARPSGGPYTAPDLGARSPRARSASTPTARRRSRRPRAARRSRRRSTRSPAAAPARRADGADQAGTATYRLDPAPAGGYTLMGSPTVVADITLAGRHLAGRGAAARRRARRPGDAGRARPVAAGDAAGPTQQVFQLHPNGWHVRRGPRGEARAAAQGLRPGPDRQLRPRLQRPAAGDGREPGAAAAGGRAAGHVDGLVGASAERFLPDGYELAADFAGAAGPAPDDEAASSRARGRSWSASSRCPAEWAVCNNVKVVARAKSKGKRNAKWSRSQRASLRR